MSNRNAEGNLGSNSIDAWFDVLSHPRRRFLCRYMMQTDADIVTHETLVEFVIERDSSVVDEVSDRQGVAMELRHVHLPKLDGLEPVDYDPQGGHVYIDSQTLAARLEAVQSMIEDLL
ncbi:hypothetical protein [Natrinema sp. HArc-T2]|uniref:DUF7344 domain-containing protein n=1 Tax=Natrinema sp. HArc-T2 TaxID=3242701 RepID=UPI00359EF5E6